MKNVLLLALVLLASCRRNAEKRLSPEVNVSQANSQAFLALAKGKAMFTTLGTHLDVTSIDRVTGAANVVIYMARFKENPHKIYAVNTLGNEILYSSDMKDEKNGSIGLMKNGEAIVIEFNNGAKTVKDISNNQFQARYASEYHGGSGFCQREKGESFGACFNAESDEFCDSFFSCVALATQPPVAILIGLACSCNAN
jgi:hypothetical protein